MMVVEMPLEGERAKGNGKRRAVIKLRAWRTGLYGPKYLSVWIHEAVVQKAA
jgi:hypothetical protein